MFDFIDYAIIVILFLNLGIFVIGIILYFKNKGKYPNILPYNTPFDFYTDSENNNDGEK